MSNNLTASLRENPIPATITAIGLAWLISSAQHRSRPSSRSSTRRNDIDHDRSSRFNNRTRQEWPDPEAGNGLRNSASRFADSVSESARHLRSKASDITDAASEQVSDSYARVQRAGDDMQRRASRTRDRLNAKARQAANRLDGMSGDARHVIHEQPLAVGIIAVAAGAFLGSLVPATRQEDEWLGEHKDALLNQARTEIRARLRQSRESVREHVEQARHEVRQDLTGHD